MNIELTKQQFRLLLDMVYIGNWILNSSRGQDRIKDYDDLESFLFTQCLKNDMPSVTQIRNGRAVPSAAFADGGIHEAIMDYEDAVFFEILAEELARRDMQNEGISQDDYEELMQRINEYIEEFDENGLENLSVDM